MSKVLLGASAAQRTLRFSGADMGRFSESNANCIAVRFAWKESICQQVASVCCQFWQIHSAAWCLPDETLRTCRPDSQDACGLLSNPQDPSSSISKRSSILGEDRIAIAFSESLTEADLRRDVLPWDFGFNAFSLAMVLCDYRRILVDSPSLVANRGSCSH